MTEAGAPGAASRGILLVEDDDDLRLDLSEILRDEGFEVAVAATGTEALAHLRTAGPPCLILLDLMMPEMDGWRLRRALLEDAALARTPVVVVSGVANLAGEAKALGAVAHVSKPFRVDSLLAIVRRYC